MAYFEKASYAQLFPKELAELFNEHGWENFLTYRYTLANKYADIRLFRAHGTDRQTRMIGMAFGYDTANSKLSDNRLVTETSILGELGYGDGTNTLFKTKVSPIDEDSEIVVYADGARINENLFEISHLDGSVVFRQPPTDGTMLSISYKMSLSAPEPPEWLTFWTFSGINLSRLMGLDGPIKLADGDGVKTDFPTPTSPIKANSIKLYVDGVLQLEPEQYTADLTNGIIHFNVPPALGKEITIIYTQIIAGTTLGRAADGDGSTKVFYTPTSPIGTNNVKVYIGGILQEPSTYSVDHAKGEFTFNSAPALGHEITIEYLDLTGGTPSGVTHLENDIKADKKIDISTPEKLMDAVYRSLDYIAPSLPTVHDFTATGTFNGAWQRDSYIYYWGNINKNRCTMFTRPDPTGNPEIALFTPLVFGKIHCKGITPRRNMIIASGCVVKNEVIYKKDKIIGGLNMDYGERTCNGNKGVLLSQGIGGAYYQQHYLKFHTYSKKADNGDGRFNPSQYNDKYFTSQFIITHPNDGDVGWVDELLAVHPKNIFQDDPLEVDAAVKNERLGIGDGRTKTFHLRHTPVWETLQIKSNCQVISSFETDDEHKTITFETAPAQGIEILADYEYSHEYRYNMPTAPISAFTLEQFSPFHPIGFGILKDPHKPQNESNQI